LRLLRNGSKLAKKEIFNAFTSGFELSTVHGPLIGERIMGACFVIDEIELTDPAAKDFLVKLKHEFENELEEPIEKSAPAQPAEVVEEEDKVETIDTNSKGKQTISTGSFSDTYGPITGQIMSITKDLCKKAFINAEPRIVEGMYKCEMQVDSNNLGKIYAVIGKHRGSTLEEELHEYSDLFLLKVLIPVIESFSFTDQIRKKE
jgi:ribosome assembly protein 1